MATHSTKPGFMPDHGVRGATTLEKTTGGGVPNFLRGLFGAATGSSTPPAGETSPTSGTYSDMASGITYGADGRVVETPTPAETVPVPEQPAHTLSEPVSPAESEIPGIIEENFIEGGDEKGLLEDSLSENGAGKKNGGLGQNQNFLWIVAGLGALWLFKNKK